MLLGYLYYDRLIGMLLMGFLAAIVNWHFRLQISDFRQSGIGSSHGDFVLLNRDIFVCQMESSSECPVHTLTCLSADSVLYHCLRR